MTATEFVLKYLPYAKEAESRSKIPALFILAQAGLESRWGNAAYGNNFFGKKAFSNWKGKTQELKTWECGKTGDPAKDGIKDRIIKIFPPGSPEGNGSCNSKGYYSYRVWGKFKAYDTALEGFLDHSNFLTTNPRYKNAFNFTASPEDFAREIARAGYATAPNYAEVLIRTIGDVKKILSQNPGPLPPLPSVLPPITPPAFITPALDIPPWVLWTIGGIGLAGGGYALYNYLKDRKRRKSI